MYDLIIGPLEYLMSKIYNAFGSGIIIKLLLVSIFVNLISSPLYNKAAQLQAKSVQRKANMAPWLKKIRSTFSGDERIFMTNAYYKLTGYTFKDEIASILALLVQIPFFMAAYNMLIKPENMETGFFSVPDGLLPVGGVNINVLPILMTVISIVSGILYSKKTPEAQKWSTLVLPVIFLFILYDSPAGLVIYWTFNCTFSLLRNISLQSKYGEKVESVKKEAAFFAKIILPIAFIYAHRALTSPIGNPRLYMVVGPCILAVFFVLPLFSKKLSNAFHNTNEYSTREIVLREVFLYVFIAIYLTSSLVASSPSDFYAISTEPGRLFVKPLFLLAGLLFLWFNLYLGIFSDGVKRILCSILSFMCFIAVLDNILWGNHFGVMTPDLHYEINPLFPNIWIILSLLLILALYAVYIRFSGKLRRYENMAIIVLLLSFLCSGAVNYGKILKSYAEEPEVSSVLPEKPFRLNPEKKNVIVIMLDRAVGAYLPYIFRERPELCEQYDGFTYYSNAVTTGTCTTLGAPGLFGGYEYSGPELIKDTGRTVGERHIEALKVLPTMFLQNGYHCILSGLPYANYRNTSDMTMFDDFENTDTYNLEFSYALNETLTSDTWDPSEALFSYALFKASPYFAQGTMYYMGCEGYKDNPEFTPFPRSYSILDRLPEMTEISDASEAPFFIEFNNNATHNPVFLRLPDYVYSEDAEDYDRDYIDSHPDYVAKMDELIGDMYRKMSYQTNAGAIRLLGEWFDYLRECGVYDNTRIIIASDHGYPYFDFDNMLAGDDYNAEVFSCVLMCKDFDSHGFMADEALMTNADVPALTTNGLLTDCTNPYTGSPFILDPSKESVTAVLSKEWNLGTGNTYPYTNLYQIQADVMDADNYTIIPTK